MDGTANHGVPTVRTGASAIHGLAHAFVLQGTAVQRVKLVSLGMLCTFTISSSLSFFL